MSVICRLADPAQILDTHHVSSTNKMLNQHKKMSNFCGVSELISVTLQPDRLLLELVQRRKKLHSGTRHEQERYKALVFKNI